MFDIIIIGAGIIGCQMAYTLSLTDLRILVLEKNAEVLDEVSSANSGIIHTGYDPKDGTLKAKLNVRGAFLYRAQCAKLQVPLMECGSLLVAHEDQEILTLKDIQGKAESRQIPCRLLNQDETRQEEPNIAPSIIASLYFPTTASILPWQMGYALIDNACQNGVLLHTSEPVVRIIKGETTTVITPKASYQAKMVINCSGLSGDRIARMADPTFPHVLRFKKGEYQVTDKTDATYLNHIIFPLPTEKGKGVLAVKTVEGNLLIGPNSVLVDDPYNNDTTPSGLAEVNEKIRDVIVPLPQSRMIRQFAGVRPSSPTKDFIIGNNDNWINVIGIDSPGLASSPAIAEYVFKHFVDPLFHPVIIDRPVYLHQKPLNELDHDARNALIKSNPDYGKIVCLCEDVSMMEVINAIHSPAQTKSIKGIKRRCRPGSGRCQGGFCEARIVDLLAQELKIPKEQVLYDNDDSAFLTPMEALYETK